MVAGSMPSHDEAVALFERRRQAWLREDIDGYLGLWHPDCEFGSPMHQPPLRGRDAFAALVRQSNSAARPVRFDIRHLAVDGEVVLAEWDIGIAGRQDGREVAWSGMSVCVIRDGLIVRWREYWNPADLGLGRG